MSNGNNNSKRKDIIKSNKGFIVKPSELELNRQAREKKIIDLRKSPKANPTNRDIQELLLDIAERQSEIYDMLKLK